MKKCIILTVLVFVLISTGAFAKKTKSTTEAISITAMTLNGATGLITIPDAYVQREESKFSLDLGYAAVWVGGNRFDHLPRFSLSLFQRVEISGLLEITNKGVQNFVIGGKVQILNLKKTTLAIGGDFELYTNDLQRNSSKIYLATTYGGKFFGLPTVTTVTIGWEILNQGSFGTQFLYGMGFSVGILPQLLNNSIFWVTDFANFSYVTTGALLNAQNRGAFNTGIRIHPIKKGQFRLVVDILGTDLLDSGQRGLSLSVSGGFII